MRALGVALALLAAWATAAHGDLLLEYRGERQADYEDLAISLAKGRLRADLRHQTLLIDLETPRLVFLNHPTRTSWEGTPKEFRDWTAALAQARQQMRERMAARAPGKASGKEPKPIRHLTPGPATVEKHERAAKEETVGAHRAKKTTFTLRSPDMTLTREVWFSEALARQMAQEGDYPRVVEALEWVEAFRTAVSLYRFGSLYAYPAFREQLAVAFPVQFATSDPMTGKRAVTLAVKTEAIPRERFLPPPGYKPAPLESPVSRFERGAR
jgi:hypothetical protein